MIPPNVTHDVTPEPPVGRYSEERIRHEIEQQIQKRPRGAHVALARRLGIASQELTKRLNGTYALLTIEQLGVVADHFGAPTGWPFIEWGEASSRDEAWKARKRRP
jgi:hypothetical protein